MSKVTAKYQITIPINIRKELGVVPGSEVDIIKEKGKYVLIFDPIRNLKKKWCGRLKDGKTTFNYLDDVRGKID